MSKKDSSYTPSARRQRGFTLIELLVALALGLLVSIGIIALFQSTNNTNRVQDAQARLQENGRYAVSRLIDDMRMGFGQPMSVEVNAARQAANNIDVVQSPMVAPMVYVANIANFLPRWVTGDVAVPTAWTTAKPGQPYPLSPRWLIQGHECAVGAATCAPTVPATLPAIGTGVGGRVRGADVLTVRYIGSPGWEVANIGTGASNARQACDSSGTVPLLNSLVIAPQAGEPATNFVSNDLLLMWNGNRGTIFQVAVSGGGPGSASQTLTPINVLPTPVIGARIPCGDIGSNNTLMVYNFSRDLRTATYFLQLIADPNPDAPAGRVIPALMRWVEGAPLNARAADILATGVERLDFLYGVETLANATSATRNAVYNYYDASQMQTVGTMTNCPLPATQFLELSSVYPLDANCMWRAVRTIEAHMLINTVNDIQFLTPTDEAFRYSVNGGTAVNYVDAVIPTGAAMANGLARGRMLRREFTAQIAVRNGTP